MSSSKRNLMIVAHPDDETIFGGVQLLTDSYKVICVTNADNSTRKNEFISVMKELNHEYEIWDFPDIKEYFNENCLKEKLKIACFENKFNKIVTHNKNGDYGHIHHKQINNILTNLNLPIWTFSQGEFISDEFLKKKLELLSLYKSQIHVWNRPKFQEYIKRESIQF